MEGKILSAVWPNQSNARKYNKQYKLAIQRTVPETTRQKLGLVG